MTLGSATGHSTSLPARARATRSPARVVASTAAALAVVLPLLSAAGTASAQGSVSATVSIPARVSYDGSGQCIYVPVTLNVSGGISNGFAYWTSDQERLAGRTSSPSPVSFFFDNEDAPGREDMLMCPSTDRPGKYTYSADITFNNYEIEGGDESAGRVATSFVLRRARTNITRTGPRTWTVGVTGQRYLVPYPTVLTQKRVGGTWKTIARSKANGSGSLRLPRRPVARYRLLFKGNVDRALAPSRSVVFRRP